MGVIVSFRSKVLKRYWNRGDDSGIRPDWRAKVRLVLGRLDMQCHVLRFLPEVFVVLRRDLILRST